MAHAHDQTLLTRLGFQDPDRKTPDHDLACRYLAQRDQLRKIVALYMPHKSNNYVDGMLFDRCTVGSAELEQPLTKGERQYKTHIGFLDIAARFTLIDTTRKHDTNLYVVIEVKIQPVDVGTILRQLNLYKQYVPSYPQRNWLLATAFSLNVEEVKSLGDVKHVYLDPAYKMYANQPVAESQVI